MKTKIILLSVIGLLFSLATSAQAHKDFKSNVGFDPITQGFYLGFDNTNYNHVIGLDLGSSFGFVMPLNVTLSLDNAFYFGKLNNYGIKTLHANARASYSQILVENKPMLFFLTPSVGNVFSLNDKLALNMEVGYTFQVLNDWGEGLIGGGTIYHFGGMSSPTIRIELMF
jgi:hypothetical protein